MTVIHPYLVRNESHRGPNVEDRRSSLDFMGILNSSPSNSRAGYAAKKSTKMSSVKSFSALSALAHVALHDMESSQPLKKRLKRSESAVDFEKPAPVGVLKSRKLSNAVIIKPEDFLRCILDAHGIPMDRLGRCPDSSFLPIAQQNHDCYPQVAQAARNQNLEELVHLHQAGFKMQCSNTFGESIIHIVCRRGDDTILKYLIETAKVSLRVRDDVGRTVLHDAAWTDKPNFDLVARILSIEPDLLFVRDKRGFSPLAYIPRPRWGQWNHFLSENLNLTKRRSANVEHRLE